MNILHLLPLLWYQMLGLAKVAWRQKQINYRTYIDQKLVLALRYYLIVVQLVVQTLERKCKNGLTKRSGFCLALSKCINFQLFFLFSLVRFVKQNYFPHFWFGQKLKTAVRLVPFVPIELNLGSFRHTMALNSWLSLWKTVLPILMHRELPLQVP